MIAGDYGGDGPTVTAETDDGEMYAATGAGYSVTSAEWAEQSGADADSAESGVETDVQTWSTEDAGIGTTGLLAVALVAGYVLAGGGR